MTKQSAVGSGQLAEAEGARVELENALDEVQATPYEVPFQKRVDLALKLAELYVDVGEKAKARSLLSEETAFAEKRRY